MTKQATAVFATSNGSDRIQLLINRSWRKHLLTSCLTWSIICMLASSSMPRSRTVPVGGTHSSTRQVQGQSPLLLTAFLSSFQLLFMQYSFYSSSFYLYSIVFHHSTFYLS